MVGRFLRSTLDLGIVLLFLAMYAAQACRRAEDVRSVSARVTGVLVRNLHALVCTLPICLIVPTIPKRPKFNLGGQKLLK